MSCACTASSVSECDRDLLVCAMGCLTGLEHRSVEDDLCNYETADYAICRCDVRAQLVESNGTRRVYGCPECGAQITEVQR